MQEMSYNLDEESSLDASSPRYLNSPSVSFLIFLLYFKTELFNLFI